MLIRSRSYYQVIMTVDIFQYSNMYTLRKNVQWLADECHVKDECGPYVTKHAPGLYVPSMEMPNSPVAQEEWYRIGLNFCTYIRGLSRGKRYWSGWKHTMSMNLALTFGASQVSG
jgi:hypothetical protein